MPAATRPIFGAEPSELSLLFVLFYIAASGNEQNVGTFERNFNTRDGAQMFRFFGGSHQIAARLAQRARLAGDAGIPGAADRAGQGGVRSYSDRVIVKAQRAIVAVPPVLAGRSTSSPGCRPAGAQLTQRIPQGTLMKVACRLRPAVLARRRAQRAGAVADGPGSRPSTIRRPTAAGRRVRLRRRRRGAQFSTLSTADGARRCSRTSPTSSGRGVNPTEFFETDWPGERWSRGGPVGIAGPGRAARLRPGAARAGRADPLGRHRDLELLDGYMDGAVGPASAPRAR